MKNVYRLIILICLLYLTLAILAYIKKPTYSILFLNPVCLRPLHGINFETCDDLTVLIDQIPTVIASGFVTDLASIPRALYAFYRPNKYAYVSAGVLHDGLYACLSPYNRYEVDNIFYSALIGMHVGRFTAYKFYATVRLMGWMFYRNEKCALDENALFRLKMEM